MNDAAYRLLAAAAADAAEDVFAQVGLTLAPEEWGRITLACHEIVQARRPLPPDVARLVQQRYQINPRMTLDEFRATGVDCEDLGAALDDARWDDVKGRGSLYLGKLYIERVWSAPARCRGGGEPGIKK
jgi:hypothetical protein